MSNAVIVLGFTLLLPSPATAPQARPHLLFREVRSRTVPAELQGRGVLRVRQVVLDPKLFQNPNVPPITEMNFFSDVRLIVSWSRAEKQDRPSGLIWTGKIQRPADGPATLVISGKAITANVTRNDGMTYQIRTSADGKYWVREVDLGRLPRESEALDPKKRPR